MPKDKVSQAMVSRFVSLEICLKDMEHAIDQQTESIENLVNVLEEDLETDPYKELLESIDKSLKWIVKKAKSKE